MIRKRTQVSLALLALFLGALTLKSLDKTLDVNDLVLPAEAGSEWDTSARETFPIQEILNQKFYFLGKGHQAYAFASEDGQYVLKFFRYYYPKITLPFLSFRATHIPFFKEVYQLFAGEKRYEQRKLDFKSYINAFDQFKNESLLEYLHLASTSHIHKKITVFDKRDNLVTLDADTSCFLVQKRADPIEDTIKMLLKENRQEEAKLVLKKLIDLVNYRHSLGFYRATTKFRENFGCVGLEPVQIDVGMLLSREELGLDPLTPDPNIEKGCKRMDLWIESAFPELVGSIDMRKGL